MSNGELLEVCEQGSDMHRCRCPLEGGINSPGHQHVSREYEKVYYSHSGIFLGKQGLALFFIVIRGWGQNEGLGFCGFNYPAGAKG